MIATIGLFVSAVFLATAAFFLAAAIAQRWGVELVGEIRRASGPTWTLRIRGLALRRSLPLIQRRIPSSYLARLRRAIAKAGEPHGLIPEEIVLLQLLCCVILGAAGSLAGLGMEMAAQGAVLGLVVGGAYPPIVLRDRIARRQHAIGRALPFGLDLLTLSVEAGLDFSGGLARVVEKGRPGALRDEFELVLKQLRMGRTREEALKELVPRTDLAAIRSFVTAVIQADRLGTSLGKVLRNQAAQLRSERTQRAEKLAGEAPVKMLVPLIACIFPTVFLVLFGPIVFAMTVGDLGGG